MDPIPAELPHLRLGIAGFDDAQQPRLGAALAGAPAGGLAWRLGGLATGDAWCLNGARSSALPDGSVEISTSDGATPMRIHGQGHDRPMAFSIPFAGHSSTCTTFDLASIESTQAMLAKLEGWLRPLAVQHWLGSQIMHQRPELSATVFHVSVNGRLVAVVSRQGVGVLPIADPQRLHEAVWARRPLEAGEIPSHFVRCSLAEVLWNYAMRTDRDLLSPSLRLGPIHWCRVPPLPQRLFNDAHLVIARELAQAPATFWQLRDRTGLGESDLARALAALRIVGAVISERKLVAREWTRARSEGFPSHATSLAAARAWTEKTAPAPLLARGREHRR